MQLFSKQYIETILQFSGLFYSYHFYHPVFIVSTFYPSFNNRHIFLYIFLLSSQWFFELREIGKSRRGISHHKLSKTIFNPIII